MTVGPVCEHAFVSYVELHCHSAFSFLDGASLPEELVAAALERGHHALALTDHNTVSGSMEFAQAASSLGLRAIHGAEVDVVDPEGLDADAPTRHVTLLVRDAAGWRNLCRLLTRAHAHTRETPGRRRVLEPVLTLEDLAEHAAARRHPAAQRDRPPARAAVQPRAGGPVEAQVAVGEVEVHEPVGAHRGAGRGLQRSRAVGDVGRPRRPAAQDPQAGEQPLGLRPRTDDPRPATLAPAEQRGLQLAADRHVDALGLHLDLAANGAREPEGPAADVGDGDGAVGPLLEQRLAPAAQPHDERAEHHRRSAVLGADHAGILIALAVALPDAAQRARHLARDLPAHVARLRECGPDDEQHRHERDDAEPLDGRLTVARTRVEEHAPSVPRAA